MADTRGIKAGRAYVELGVGDKLTSGLKRAQARLKAFGSGMTSWGTKMLGIGTAIAAPLAGAGKVFGDFEKQMKMVSTMLDEPEKHMNSFTAGIRKLSVQFGEGTDVLAKGLYDLLSASVAPSAAMDVLGVAVKSAKGGMTDTAVAVDGLTSVLNAFQMSAGEAGHVADVMFQTVKRGKLTFPDLAANIGKLAPMARAAGMSMEDMMAGVATMTRQGLNAEEATTRMVNIIKQAPDEAKNMADLAAKYVGKSLSEIQVDFPEVRASSGIAALAADMEGFRKDLALMQSAGGEADKAFTKMTGGLSGEFKKVQMAVTDLAVSVGQALAPTLKSSLQWIRNIIATAGDWIRQNQAVVVSVFTIARNLVVAGAALMVAGKAVSYFGGMLGVVKVVLPLLLSPITLVIAAVGALAGYLLYATGAGGKALDWLGGRFGGLADVAKTAWGAIGKALARGDIAAAAGVLWASLKLAWTTGTNALLEVWLWFKGAFLKAAYWAFYGTLEIAEAVWHALKVAWIETTSFLADAWTRFSAGVSQAWYVAGNLLAKQWNTLSAYWSEFSGLLQTYWQKAVSGVQSIWVRAQAALEMHWNALKAVWESIWNSAPVQAAASVVSFVWDAITTRVSKAWQQYTDMARIGMDTVRKLASAVFNGLTKVIASQWARLLKIIGVVNKQAKSAASVAADIAGDRAKEVPGVSQAAQAMDQAAKDAAAAYERAKAKAAGENRKADEQLKARLTAIETEKKAELEKIESARKAARDGEADRHKQRLASLDAEYKAALAGTDKEKADRLAAAKEELAKAEKAWKDAIGKAEGPEGARPGPAAPDGLKNPDDLLKKVGDAAAGLGDAVKASVTGTFNAAALFGMGAGTAAERTAKATEQTARNTKKLLDTVDFGGSTFV